MELITKHYAKFKFVDSRHPNNPYRERILEIDNSNPHELVLPAKTCYRIDLFDIVSTKINYKGKEIILNSNPQEVANYCIGQKLTLEDVCSKCGKSNMVYDQLTRFPNCFTGAFEDVTGRISTLGNKEILLTPEELNYKRLEDEND